MPFIRAVGLVLLTYLILSLSACGTEKQYFKKILTRNDREFLSKHKVLIKDFSGQVNWYKQYWTGKLLIRKANKSYDFKQIGKWNQTSKDGKQFYAIAIFDNYGDLQNEKIFSYDGTIDVETTCRRDTTDNTVVLKCETIWRYVDTKTIRLESKSLIIDGKSYKHGIWQYYSKEGGLIKTEEYKMNRKLK